MGGRLERLSRQLGDALDSLGGAVDTGDRAARDLRLAVEKLRQSASGLTTAVSRLDRALDAFQGFLEDLGSGSISVSSLLAAREELRQAFRALRGVGDDLDDALSQLQQALSRSGALSSQLGDALDTLEEASDTSAVIGRLLRRALDTIGDAVDTLTEDGPAEFTPLGEDFRQAGDSLYDAMSGLLEEMDGLNSALQTGNGTLTADLRAINRQFNAVFTLLLYAMDDARDTAEGGLEGIIQDTSDEDISATREGKVADCSNLGTVDIDFNL